MRIKSTANDNARLVYSSESGRICPDCGRAASCCVCRKKQAALAGDGIVRVRRETKGRGGKTVTTITGLPLDEAGMKALAGELKRRCGTGGAVKDGLVEIQGDHRELLLAELAARGFRAKAAGG